MKSKCKLCGKEFEVTEEEAKWKDKCVGCFIKSKNPEQEKEKKEIIKNNGKDKETTDRIQFGNCLNASGMALSGTGTTPERHFAYAMELYELWTGKKMFVEEEIVNNK